MSTILDLIGNTPLVEAQQLNKNKNVKLQKENHKRVEKTTLIMLEANG